MAAGLGFKTFTTGEVLTAADTNGYLMQGVLVFASSAARDAAITSPQEGQFAYLKDTNVTMYYTGSAWANLDTTGMTNPMTTTGDTIYSSSGSTPARLGIGSTGQVLTVAGGVPTWAAAAGGGKVLQVVSATTSTQVNLTTATYTDTNITATITPTSATSKILVMVTAQCRTAGSGATISYTEGNAKLVRGATDVFLMNNTNFFSVYIDGAAEVGIRHTFAFNYLDSPATTSATTYKVQANNAVGNLFFQVNSNTSQIILMEIGA